MKKIYPPRISTAWLIFTTGWLAGLLLIFSGSTAQAQCSVTITRTTASGCYFVSGQSKSTVQVEVAWTNAPASGYIVVTTQSQSRTITPGGPLPVAFPQPDGTTANGSSNFFSSQIVAFEVPANGTVNTVVATFNNAATCTDTDSYTAPSGCIPTACPGGQLGGVAFNDYNANGIRDSGETFGASGISVKVIDCFNNVHTTTTDTYGQYAFTGANAIPTANYPVRVEFTVPLLVYGNQSTLNGTNSRTTVQFVKSPSCSLDIGVLTPVDYSQPTPQIFVPCFVYGDPLISGSSSATSTALASVPYGVSSKTYAGEQMIASAAQIGTTWGSAWNKYTKRLFLSAVLKRHAGLGPLGLGGIYVVNYSNPTAPATTTLVNVASLGVNVGSIPSNAARGLLGDKTLPSADPDSFTAIGKVGIGDIDISDDGNTLWFVNLFDSKLYSLDLTAYNATGTKPTSASLVKSYTIPNPGCVGGEFRSWGLKAYRGNVYVGGICNGITTHLKANLRAIVYSFNGSTFTEVFNFPLTYPKGYANYYVSLNITNWFTWHDDFTQLIARNLDATAGDNTSLIRPQPILSDIEFDIDGSMVLGFGDRTGLQGGDKNYSPSSASDGFTLYSVNSAAGDILRAYKSGSTFVLENNGKAGPATGSGVNNKQGPGFGEFYNDNWNGDNPFVAGGLINKFIHAENALGGLALRPGSGEVITTTIDPVDGVPFSGGIRYLNNQTGDQTGAYAVYITRGSGGANIPGTFAKATGLGDIELAINPPTYLEIGNRVWVDANKDGVQDACEKPLPNVAVRLYQGTTLVASTTTNADGEYYVNNNPVSSTVAGTVSTTSLLPNTAYSIVFGGASQFASNVLTVDAGRYELTVANSTSIAVGSANDTNDSDAQLATVAGILAPTISVTTGSTGGATNHTYDAGFYCLTTTVASVSVTPATCVLGSTASNTNGRVELTGIVNADKVFLVTAGSTVPSYTATGSQPVSSSAVAFTGLANPASTSGTSYSLVVYNGPCCYTVVTALLPHTVCLACSLAVAGVAGACQPSTNQYSVTGTLSFSTVPAGTVTLSDGSSSTPTKTLSLSVAAGITSLPFTLTGLTSGGRVHTLTVTFSSTVCAPASFTYLSPVSCTATPCVGTNLLVNPSFEQGFPSPPAAQTTLSPPIGWVGGTADNNQQAFAAADGYAYGFTNDATPTLCQTATATAGGTYNLTFFAGVHQANGQTVTLSFLNAGNAVLSPIQTFTSTHILDFPAGDGTFGGPYSLSGVAPTGTTQVRVCAVGASGSGTNYWSKIDNLCLTATPPCLLGVAVSPPVCNTTTNNFTTTGTVSLSAALASSLTIIDNGTVSAVISVSAGQTSAIFSLTGVSNASSHTVTVISSATLCGFASTTYSAPATCTVCPLLTISPGTLPSAQVNTAYSQQLTASGGVTPYIFTLAGGTMPASLSLSAGGLISGTLTAGGSFTVKVIDARSCTAVVALSISTTCPAIAITPSTLPGGQVGVAYSQTLTASGGIAPYTFVAGAGNLHGLSVSTRGLISGIPSAAGATSFTVLVTASNGCTAVVPLSIPVVVCSLSATATAGLCNTATNTHTVTVTATVDYPTTGTITITTGGLTRTFATTASAQNTFTVNFGGLISDGLSHTATVNLPGCGSTVVGYTAPASCSVCPLITINPTALPNAQVGTFYTQNLTASGGIPNYTYAILAGELPAGLTLAANGGISGTPTSATTTSVTVVVTDAKACTATVPLTIQAICPTIIVAPTLLANGQAGAVYSQTISASGGKSPYVFTAATTMPAGLSLNPATGVISGTPTATGTFSFSGTAVDTNNCPAVFGFSITVGSAPVCSLSATVTPGTCSSATNTYSLTGTVSAINSPASQTLTVSAGTSASTIVVLSGDGPVSYSLGGLLSDGAGHTVTLLSSASACGMATVSYTAPVSCSVTPTYAIGKVVNLSQVEKGQVVTYTVSLTNTSIVPVTNVLLTDQLSTTAITFTGSVTASAGTFAPTVSGGTWSVSTLAVGQIATLSFRVQLNQEGITYNTVTAPNGQTATVCTSVPFRVCANEPFEFLLSAPNSYSAYQWFLNGQPIAGATSSSVSATTLGQYTVSVNGAGGCATGACCPYIIDTFGPAPSLTAVAVSASCVGATAQNDAAITLAGLSSNAVSYNITRGSSFSATTPLFGSPQPLSAVSVGGKLLTNQPDSVTGQAYTIRVYSAEGCFSDIVVTILPANCKCPPPKCIPIIVLRKTKANG